MRHRTKGASTSSLGRHDRRLAARATQASHNPGMFIRYARLNTIDHQYIIGSILSSEFKLAVQLVAAHRDSPGSPLGATRASRLLTSARRRRTPACQDGRDLNLSAHPSSRPCLTQEVSVKLRSLKRLVSERRSGVPTWPYRSKHLFVEGSHDPNDRPH
jgi:hypothetical protein